MLFPLKGLIRLCQVSPWIHSITTPCIVVIIIVVVIIIIIIIYGLSSAPVLAHHLDQPGEKL